MMLRSVYLKTIRDHWVGVTVAVVSLFLLAWMGLWAYSGVDDADTYLAQMPDEYVQLLGITKESGTAGLMFSTMFSMMSPFVFAGLALSMAASSIAGEERDGTMNVLATAPRTRTRLLTSKTLAIATLIVVGNIVTWGLYLLAASVTGADISTLNLAAATVHVTIVSLFYGAVALAIGAATGNRARASGIATGLVILSFLGAGLLPLFDGWEDVAKIFPWYYLNGAQPLIEGVAWGQMAVIAALAVALFGVAVWGINRRDLLAGAGRASLMDKLRADPRLAKALGRLQGAGSARGITSKAFSDQRGLSVVATYALLLFLIVMGPLFKALGSTLGDVVNSMPDALLAMIGYADYSTPTGWYHGEALSIYSPVVASIVAIAAGAALAGEEKRRTIGVLLSAPVSRVRVAVGKLTAMAVLAMLVGLTVFAGIGIGNWISSLGMNVANIAAAGALIGAFGLMIGSVAFVFGGFSGRSSAAVWGATGVAFAAWAINTFVTVNPDLDWFARVSPFYWVLHNHPLDNGMDWTGLAVLLTEFVVLSALGVWAYRRRDLKG